MFQCAVIVVCSILLVAPAVYSGEKTKTEPAYVAKVNGTIITEAEFERELNMTLKQYQAMGQQIFDAHLDAIKERVVEVMIDRELLFQESQKEKIVLKDAMVDEQFEQWKKYYAPDGNYAEVLKETGYTEETLRADLKKMAAIQALIETRFQSKVVVTDEDVKTFYDSHPDFFKQPEQVKASHILIKVAPEATQEEKDAARKKLEGIKKQLDEGADFATLAKENSDCPSSAKGGDLGSFGPGQMVKPFEEVAFSIEVNKVSEIVETQFGYHLIMVTEKVPAKTVTLEESKDSIEQHLRGQKLNEEVRAFVASLREKAAIEQPGKEEDKKKSEEDKKKSDVVGTKTFPSFF